MPTFTWAPSYGSDVTKKPRIRKATFGDGYVQRTADGINNSPQVWNLKFENISAATADAIAAFLDAQGGTTQFDWTPPGGVAAKFVCEEGYSRTHTGYASFSMSMTFQQDFAP